MVKEWLKTAADPPPSWEAIVTALRSPSVNEKSIAAQLEAKYCAPIQHIHVVEKSNIPTNIEKTEGIASFLADLIYSFFSLESPLNCQPRTVCYLQCFVLKLL